MGTPNLQIVRNTILNFFKVEERLLTKKEIVKKTKFTNRIVKDVLTDLTTEKYLKREGTNFSLIKSFSREKASKGEIQKALLNIFKNLEDTDKNLKVDVLFVLLENKYEKQQIHNGLSYMVKINLLERSSRGIYTLAAGTTHAALKERKIDTSHVGITEDIRTILPQLAPKFEIKEVSKLLAGKYTRVQISNSLRHLTDVGELSRITFGIYSVIAAPKHEHKEILLTDALEEKKESIIRKEEVLCTDALHAAKKFVKLQLGYKKLEGDYALVVKFGGTILKQKGWDMKQPLMLAWVYELKRLRIFPFSDGFKSFLNNDGICEVVFPLPEGTEHQFPKPFVSQSDEKHKDINIPMENVTYIGNDDIVISLLNVDGIDYV